jgi:hypothetical protein
LNLEQDTAHEQPDAGLKKKKEIRKIPQLPVPIAFGAVCLDTGSKFLVRVTSNVWMLIRGIRKLIA